MISFARACFVSSLVLTSGCSEPQCLSSEVKVGTICRSLGKRGGDGGVEQEPSGEAQPDSGAGVGPAAKPTAADEDAAVGLHDSSAKADPNDELVSPVADSGAWGASAEPLTDAAMAGVMGDAATGTISAGDSCTPGIEDCFNGVDDDCDGQPDCSDSDCTTAMCVSEGAQIGALIRAGSACPAGFAASKVALHRNPSSSSCSGCSCTAPTPAQCSIAITASSWGDPSAPLSGVNACEAGGVAPSQVLTATVNSFDCATEPTVGGADGVVTGPINTTPGTCAAIGSPVVSGAEWRDEAVLCVAERKGSGCGKGKACVPRSPTSDPICSRASNTCAPGEKADIWYSGAVDERKCSSCSCGVPDASCAQVGIEYGNDWLCTGAGTLSANSSICQSLHGPIMKLRGYRANGSCQPISTPTGELRPIDPAVLCCL